MTPDRIVMIGCAALLVVSVFANQREGVQVRLGAGDVVAPHARLVDSKPLPASPPTHTDLLVALMNDGCIEWYDPLAERDMMTCGDTVPAIQVVSYQLRYVP